jgi:hypothetical protein
MALYDKLRLFYMFREKIYIGLKRAWSFIEGFLHL